MERAVSSNIFWQRRKTLKTAAKPPATNFPPNLRLSLFPPTLKSKSEKTTSAESFFFFSRHNVKLGAGGQRGRGMERVRGGGVAFGEIGGGGNNRMGGSLVVS